MSGLKMLLQSYQPCFSFPEFIQIVFANRYCYLNHQGSFFFFPQSGFFSHRKKLNRISNQEIQTGTIFPTKLANYQSRDTSKQKFQGHGERDSYTASGSVN